MRTLSILLSLALLSGCSTAKTPVGGALVGTAVGAGAGAGIGALSGNAGPGAAIGAPVGAVAGALIAGEAEKRSIEENQALITANQQAIVNQEVRLRAAQQRLEDDSRAISLPESRRERRYEGPTVMPYYR